MCADIFSQVGEPNNLLSDVLAAAIQVLKFNHNILRLFVELIAKWGSLYPRVYFIGLILNSLIVTDAPAFFGPSYPFHDRLGH